MSINYRFRANFYFRFFSTSVSGTQEFCDNYQKQTIRETGPCMSKYGFQDNFKWRKATVDTIKDIKLMFSREKRISKCFGQVKLLFRILKHMLTLTFNSQQTFIRMRYKKRDICSIMFSPGKLCFDVKQIATEFILPCYWQGWWTK